MTPQQANLLSIGSEMSNVLWNLGQHKRREITEREGEMFYALAKKWDEARRAPAPTEPAVDRASELAMFAAWATENLGQGYSLLMEDHTYVDPVTRWAFAAWRGRAALATPASPAVPGDPMDWPLPCDITVGAGTIKAGCKLRTLVARMKMLHEAAMRAVAPQLPQAPQPTSAEGKDGDNQSQEQTK